MLWTMRTLPVEVTMQLLAVMWKLLARDEFIAFYVRQSERSRTDSTIGRLLSGVSTLFVRSPSSRLRHLQRGFDLVQRDLGRMGVVEASETEALYLVEDLPDVLRNECYDFAPIGCALDQPMDWHCGNAGSSGRIDELVMTV
jgi:hypothetical protein